MASAAAIGAGVLVAPQAVNAAPAATPQIRTVAATSTITSARRAKQRERADYAVRYAYKQIGDPYRYGAAGPGSWDCSGLAGGSWRKAGVKLPRTSQQLYRAVKYKVSWKGAVKGDLLFFYGGRTHVGIYVGKGYMIHAPSSGQRVKRIKLNSYYKRNFNGGVRPGY
ncbi:Murein DD-endopeptidase MepH precursor [Actinomadura rubteroloni]|uniref:Murein DD-endopeptidase MepH n=1 Tax=Actinomadura rubteroloni TaxID=1926885 RepID=A0A2P4UP02_9ACTN|nr:NlpC/P60 family protein [Actinomadura rubteroloni]POM26774.1 Murein DD-endopeptidase MepH precursor [Actinomadura rubteroloni]